MFSTIQYFFRGCRRGEEERGEEEEEEEEEAVFISVVNTNEDPPIRRNTAQNHGRDECVASVHA